MHGWPWQIAGSTEMRSNCLSSSYAFIATSSVHECKDIMRASYRQGQDMTGEGGAPPYAARATARGLRSAYARRATIHATNRSPPRPRWPVRQGATGHGPG